jgi:hypothetical protein
VLLGMGRGQREDGEESGGTEGGTESVETHPGEDSLRRRILGSLMLLLPA